ncbi:MAG: alkene reductase [Steroidobacteraceae bacterium]|nr:alkene reductase [Steroidobacteraceae bacterium]
MTASLFEPVQLGDILLANRVVMAPMTRSRAGPGDVPTELNVEYYRQRASAGLIVSEGVQPSANGKGYCRTPGLHTEAQVAGWRAVNDAVHAEGGRIVAQIMHCGRVGSHLNKDPGAETVAPSAVRAKGQIYTDAAGMVDLDEPRALRLDEIPGVIGEYRHATQCALQAGFDGVELHCTSGYLPAQFLSTGTNLRTDAYGGSVQNRVRFVLEVLEAMTAVAGSGRVGMRICPGNPFNDLHDENPHETFATLLDAVSPMKLAYLHVIRSPRRSLDAFALAREHFRGALIVNDGFDRESADRVLGAGQAAAVSFGRSYIGNPDLVRRLREGLPLADFDLATLYTPGPKGYTDYTAAS